MANENQTAAKVKFLTGGLESLPQTKTAGQVYFAIEDIENKKGQIIFDKDTSNRFIMATSPSATVAYAICETAGSTNTKDIVIQNNNSWILEAGSSLFVKFTNTNTSNMPKFNIWYDHEYRLEELNKQPIAQNKLVYFDNFEITTDNINRAGYAGRILHYVYDGSVFWFIGWTSLSDINVATNNTLGALKPWISHSVAAAGPVGTRDDVEVEVNDISTTSGRYYAIELDSNGRAFVNVPWEQVSKMEPLTIGSYTYDGSAPVTIGTYQGDYTINI